MPVGPLGGNGTRDGIHKRLAIGSAGDPVQQDSGLGQPGTGALLPKPSAGWKTCFELGPVVKMPEKEAQLAFLTREGHAKAQGR